MQRWWMARFAASALALVTVLDGLGTAANAGGSAPKPPDLSGTWVTDMGEVQFMQAGTSATAIFSNGGTCKNGDHLTRYIDGHFKDASNLVGTIRLCTNAQVLIDKCGLAKTFSSPFHTTSISKNSITGTFMSEWYDAAKGDQCKFTRNAAKDTPKTFTLTRKTSSPCPDTAQVKQLVAVSGKVTKYMSFAAGHMTDPGLRGTVSRSQNAISDISGLLGKYADAGEKCDQIDSLLGQIDEFEAAIDQINNAGCNTNVLAAGFDNLFRTAGQVGQQFNPIPELKPIFALLAANQNFFATTSSNLDPEQRWADQFQHVDGYVPNCAQ